MIIITITIVIITIVILLALITILLLLLPLLQLKVIIIIMIIITIIITNNDKNDCMYNCQSCCDSVVDIHDGIISNVQLAVISEWISPVSNAVYLELNIMTQAKNLILYTREGITIKTCMEENFDLQSYSYGIQYTIFLRYSIERLKVTNRNFKS